MYKLVGTDSTYCTYIDRQCVTVSNSSWPNNGAQSTGSGCNTSGMMTNPTVLLQNDKTWNDQFQNDQSWIDKSWNGSILNPRTTNSRMNRYIQAFTSFVGNNNKGKQASQLMKRMTIPMTMPALNDIVKIALKRNSWIGIRRTMYDSYFNRPLLLELYLKF